jgi:hypothetical protein
VGTFPKKKWAQIPRKIYVSLLSYFSVVGGHTVRIRTESESGHANRGNLWHNFRGRFKTFVCCFWAV